MEKQGMWFRCRDCGTEFRAKPTPNTARIMRCKKCGSDNVEPMSAG